MMTSRQLVVWPHHRDTLQLPAADRWDPPAAEAMTWNVFRTLELMPPAFWLRRLNAFLGLLPPQPAPVTATVRLWAPLPIPPGFGLSASDTVRADVFIETEHAVWALIVIAILRDISRGDVIPSVERVVAQRTLEWCEEVVCQL